MTQPWSRRQAVYRVPRMTGVFGSLTRKRRWRAAALLAVLYALCLATPTAVMAASLAVSPAAIPALCLTDDHHEAGIRHVHDDGAAHHHSGGKADDGDHASKCCGCSASARSRPTSPFCRPRSGRPRASRCA